MFESIQQRIDYHDIISFDIFDTLIVRPFVKPTDTFLYVERITGLKKFAVKRKLAEREARLKTTEGEISYSDIYRKLSKKYQVAYDIELELEKRILLRNEEIYQVYQYALEKKKRIIFISDMYLPQEIIESILHKAGYQAYEYLFLSSRYKKTKDSGELFDVAIHHLKTPAENILHIGDNKRSDIEMATAKGLHTAFYPKIIDRFMDEYSNLHVLLKRNLDNRFKRDELTISLVLGMNAILWSEGKTLDYWTRLGSLYAGPLLYFFTRWVYDNAKKSGVKNIAFVGRDGYNIERIFELFDQKNEFNTQYIYLPRYVSETSNLNTETDFHLFFEEIGETSEILIRFISDFSEADQQIKDNWIEFRNKKMEEDVELTDHILQAFILANKDLFIRNSKKGRELVFDYLTHKGLLNDHLIFVDSTTTHARAQRLIRNIITEKGIDISLYGYYYKINQQHKILDQKEIRPFRDRKYRTDKWDIMEYFMSAPEPPILSIRKDGCSFSPVYQDISNNNYERIRIETCKGMSAGVMLFTKRVFDVFDDMPVIHDLDTVVLIVNNLINNPSVQDLAIIKNLHHTINNDNHYKPIITKYRKPKGSVPKIFGQRVNVERITPKHEHFFSGGANDKTINNEGGEILGLNVAFMDRLPHLNDKADIYVFSENKVNYFIDSIFEWNFQKGAVLQYRPLHEHEIIYNSYVNKTHVSVIFNLTNNIKRLLPLPIACISDDGKKALCLYLNSAKIGSYYQYATSKSFHDCHKNDVHQGLFLLDLDSAKYQLILSQDELLSMIEKKPFSRDKMMIYCLSFAEHVQEFYIELGRTISKGISESKKTFFFNFQENHKGKITAQRTNSRQIINKQLVLSIPGESPVAVTENIMSGNIEPEALPPSPEMRYVLSETPSSQEFPYRKLQMHDSWMHKSITLGTFYSDPDFYNGISACECRLNPRWSPCGKFFLIDSIHEGFRGIYLINSSQAIREFEKHEDLPFVDEELISIIKQELPVEKFRKLIFLKRKIKMAVIRFMNYLTNNRMFESN